MIQREDNDLIVDYVKRVSPFSRVADAGDMSQIPAMMLREVHQRASDAVD
jgi:hypothetical protein